MLGKVGDASDSDIIEIVLYSGRDEGDSLLNYWVKLLFSDGDPSRASRNTIYDSNYKYIGIGTGGLTRFLAQDHVW